MVIAEAASQGIPAIVKNVGAVPEITNYAENGDLFESSQELASILSSANKKRTKEEKG